MSTEELLVPPAVPVMSSPQVLEPTVLPATQPPPMSRHARQRTLARLRVRKIFRALYAIGGFSLALMWFWPKVNISMEPRDDAVVWLYTVRNDSLLPITNVEKVNDTSFTIRPCVNEFELKLGPDRKSACGPETVRVLRSGDQHTFKCLVPTFDPPTDQIGGSVQLRANYRYLGFIPMSSTACFEYAPKSDGLPRYLRRSCSTPARTLTSPPC